MNLCILTQCETNKSCLLVKEALEKKGYKVTLLQYPNDRAVNNESSWTIDTETGIATRGDETLNIKDFDGMMVRSWGTAPTAATYASAFEKFGITVANDVDKTTKSNSKVETTRIFQENNVSMPNSEPYFFKEIEGQDLSDLIEPFAKDKENFVVKSDYGTRGEKIKFFSNPQEAEEYILSEKENGQKGFVLQDFCNTGKQATSYRVLVVGGQARVGMELTSQDGKLISNVSAGGTTRLLEAHELAELNEVASEAAKALGMECCSGVDLVRDLKTGKIYVLEANDGPGISTIVDNHEIPLHEWVADAFVEKVMKEKLSKGEEVVDHQKFLEPSNQATAVKTTQSKQGTQNEESTNKTTSEKKKSSVKL